MKVVTLAAQKGGTGKSTLTAHLAVALEEIADKRVAVLDLDPQGSISNWAAARQAPCPTVVAGTPDNLGQLLEAAQLDGFDVVLIDTPPHTGETARLAATVSDLLLMPVRPGGFDLQAITGTVQIAFETATRARFVLNQVPARGSDAADSATVLALNFPDAPVAGSRIGMRKSLMTSLLSGLSVTEVARQDAKAVSEIRALAAELLDALGIKKLVAAKTEIEGF